MTRATNRRIEYKVEVDWAIPPDVTDTLEGIADDVVSLRFCREKRSHRGISRLRQLRQLIASGVNHECLDEISELPQLETLFITQLTATDARCLGRCRSLRHLIIKGGTKISSLSWISQLLPLESLLLEHFTKVRDICSVEAVPNLRAVGFEGGMWSVQRVESFRPIAQLPQVEALFLYACRPNADGLRPLQQMQRLRYLEIAARCPDAEFLTVRRALPRLECSWFAEIDMYGSIKAFIKARVAVLAAKGAPPAPADPGR